MPKLQVLTQGNDSARDGLNASETILTLSSVSPGNFGKFFNLPTDGAVDAQPLYAANVAIPGKGTHNVSLCRHHARQSSTPTTRMA